MGDHVGERVTVECPKEGAERLLEDQAQPAGGLDAAPALRIEALDQRHRGFGVSNHFADSDLFGCQGQTQPPTAAPDRFHVPGQPELMNHLH